MVTSTLNGKKIYFDQIKYEWFYVDTKQPINKEK